MFQVMLPRTYLVVAEKATHTAQGLALGSFSSSNRIPEPAFTTGGREAPGVLQAENSREKSSTTRVKKPVLILSQNYGEHEQNNLANWVTKGNKLVVSQDCFAQRIAFEERSAGWMEELVSAGSRFGILPSGFNLAIPQYLYAFEVILSGFYTLCFRWTHGSHDIGFAGYHFRI